VNATGVPRSTVLFGAAQVNVTTAPGSARNGDQQHVALPLVASRSHSAPPRIVVVVNAVPDGDDRSPRRGATFAPGDVVRLVATATDVEDGDPPPAYVELEPRRRARTAARSRPRGSGRVRT